ncbi:hypothetical protein F5148DRAFT_1149777 [Russula earlei]|uniref:Uncharacterized protein n=1 Tax=Russula earlei TaxID=71964 RepID=A0ACC0U6X3_9AGAM|nr:hypothetical protein F5148DRAFT_1149777 [Russula earlei]
MLTQSPRAADGWHLRSGRATSSVTEFLRMDAQCWWSRDKRKANGTDAFEVDLCLLSVSWRNNRRTETNRGRGIKATIEEVLVIDDSEYTMFVPLVFQVQTQGGWREMGVGGFKRTNANGARQTGTGTMRGRSDWDYDSENDDISSKARVRLYTSSPGVGKKEGKKNAPGIGSVRTAENGYAKRREKDLKEARTRVQSSPMVDDEGGGVGGDYSAYCRQECRTSRQERTSVSSLSCGGGRGGELPRLTHSPPQAPPLSPSQPQGQAGS